MDLKSFALGVLSFKEALVQLPVENDKRFETLVHSMAVIKARGTITLLLVTP